MASSGGGPPVLVLRAGSGANDQTWQVSEPSADLGRLPPCPVILNDRSVGRRHARITLVKGEFLLEDLASQNGTFANGRAVTIGYRINSGDQLKFGDVVLIAEVRGGAPLSTAASQDPGETRLYEGDLPPPPQPKVRARADHRPRARDESTTGSKEIGQQSTVMLGGEPPRVATPVAYQPPPGAARAAATGHSLPDLTAAADGLAGSLRQFQQEVGAALRVFEQSGGRETLQAVLERLKRLEAGQGGRDADAIANWVPMVRRLLETQLTLINLLGPIGSAGLAPTGRDELQPHPGNVERVARAH
jgi:pSer/pThr/pTyr-binding forkhead associated (FHA) protein